jgi:hypothetical protein
LARVADAGSGVAWGAAVSTALTYEATLETEAMDSVSGQQVANLSALVYVIRVSGVGLHVTL